MKGIHPREPKKKVHGAHKTYYHIKDINFLLHEPLLKTFRNLKAYDKKIKKARAKQNLYLAQRLLGNKPTYRLDHLVKERYPSFLDAIRDLDDALTMVHLFAMLPSNEVYRIPKNMIELCRRLSLEFQAYVVRTNSLRRVFVTVRGYYYQAEVLGQTVTWLVPHPLTQVLTPDVDYRVMLSFLEFYTTMLQFVNFKLYHLLGLRYPPVLDERLEKAAEGLVEIMEELAGRSVTPAEAATPEVGSALEAVEDREVEVAPDVQQRLATLTEKMREIAGTEPGGGGGMDIPDDEEQEEEDADEDEEELRIDSGDEEESGDDTEGDDEEEEEEEGEDSDQDGEEQDDKEEDPAVSASARSLGVPSTSQPEGLTPGAEVAGGALNVDVNDEGDICRHLFNKVVVFIAREVPREPLMFVIRSFGGTVGWEGEGSPIQEHDESITHQVVDRPTQGHRFLTRQYVQPQWVFDSANYRIMMPVDLYAPGKVPPPHLSPFVDNEEEGYTPDFAVTIQKLQEAARKAREGAGVDGLTGDRFVGEDEETELITRVEDDEVVERVYHNELAKEMKAAAPQEDKEESGAEKQEEEVDTEEDQDGGEDENEEEEEDEEKAPKHLVRKAQQGEEDEQLMKDIMMTRKNKKLYQRIQRAREGKRERIEVLEKRKKRLTSK